MKICGLIPKWRVANATALELSTHRNTSQPARKNIANWWICLRENVSHRFARVTAGKDMMFPFFANTKQFCGVLHAYSTAIVLCRAGWNLQWEHRPNCHYVWYHHVHFHNTQVDRSDSTESEAWHPVQMSSFILCPFACCLWADPAFCQHPMHFSWSSAAPTHSLPWLFRMVVSESHTAVSILIGGLKCLQLNYTSPPEDYQLLSESLIMPFPNSPPYYMQSTCLRRPPATPPSKNI